MMPLSVPIQPAIAAIRSASSPAAVKASFAVRDEQGASLSDVAKLDTLVVGKDGGRK